LPLVLDSPHSGNTHPPDWHPAAPRATLETAWDAYVADLWATAPDHGATLMEAHFPRSFIDLNRARDDLDPAMLDGPWPGPLAPTSKSAVGMGVLRRLALPDVPVYAGTLPVPQVQAWLAAYYDPYHTRLAAELDALHARFGAVWHINCHSMKSRGNAMNDDPGAERPDFVVSDRDGTTADPAFTRWAADALTTLGYRATVNVPYKGAELIARHSDPARNRHSIQIEINRRLYMDEAARTPNGGFAALKQALDAFLVQAARYIRAA